MVTRVQGHVKDSLIVPDEPVNWPEDALVEIELREPLPLPPPKTKKDRLAALERFLERRVKGGNIPDEALRRENLYDDRT